jgi:hypothetical protein
MWRLFAISLAFLLTARTVRASENYPDVIRATVPRGNRFPAPSATLTDGATVR